ncbi:uncharacterized protein LOC111330820 isoform X2 [Stylophora pistillata]|uniref:uncharacterized protein LOC111330820 isoform X2 n=1 Tax=Stylophora pistillata TaxID=50429 RepID=UPI000C04E133|nr:uncharacterized protein LOC111330820 isoform X2 [Stylophora pistillata]
MTNPEANSQKFEREASRYFLMAVLSLKKFAIITILPIFLEIAFSTSNKDFCGNIFETQVDGVLAGHTFSTTVVFHDFECQLQCLGSDNNFCKSFNVRPGNKTKDRICELNNSTRQLKPSYFKRKKGSIYYGSIQISCIVISLQHSGKTKSGQCHLGYKGKHCEKVVGSGCPPGKKTDNQQGACCVFPFTYMGKTFHSCTKYNWHTLWCALTATYNGTWANCVS